MVTVGSREAPAEPPEESAANRQQERQNQQFGPGHALRAAFPVIPGQDERDEEADAQRDDDEAHRLFGPVKSLRDDVDALEEREGRRDVGHCPLHQLALFQALQEFIHSAALFWLAAADFSSSWNRGS